MPDPELTWGKCTRHGLPRSPTAACAACTAERVEDDEKGRHAKRMLKRLGLAFLGLCAIAVLYGWLRARIEAGEHARARAGLVVFVFEAPGDDSTAAAKHWFREQGITARSREVDPADPLLAELRKRNPDATLPIYLVGNAAFTDFTPELAARVVDQEARRSLGGPTGVEQDGFILSPVSAVGAMAFALFGIVMAAFELALLGRVILGGAAAVLFIASFWITEAHIALGARALLVLLGAGAISFARLRGAEWLG